MDGRIIFAGPTADLERTITLPTDAHVIDAHDCSILPGFVDAHTHAVFAGDRRSELRRRLAGESYASIAASGGGIVSTVAATRAASEDELVAQSRARLDAMLACGTTTCEIKSGYGLDPASELKMLRVDPVPRRRRTPSTSRRPSWAHTKYQSNIERTGIDTSVSSSKR